MITVFGTNRAGETAHRVALSNGRVSIALLTFGAALQDVRLSGLPFSLTVGSPDLAAYESGMAHCGTIVGPVANRIAGAQATIDGTLYHFDRNVMNRHTLHGGNSPVHSKLWTIADLGEDSATFTLNLPHGEGGFPGNRHLAAHYHITGSTLSLQLSASTDAPTLMNLANHSYWNLGPDPTTANHRLTVHAKHYLPAHQQSMLPTGEIADVAGTRFDYRNGRAVRAGAEGLIDTNFCLATTCQPLREIARLTGPAGVTMAMSSTAPGLQIYDGHSLDLPEFRDMDGRAPRAYAGLALEAQFWPDAPNHADFPPILLRPGDSWRQTTTWEFHA